MTDYIGTYKNDLLSGSRADDYFDLAQGGRDTVLAGAGYDRIVFGATLTALDRIDGGKGEDQLWISGDYSAGLTLAGDTIKNIETFGLQAGGEYDITLADENLASGAVLTVAVTDNTRFDASAETDGAIGFEIEGHGHTLVGGAGNDGFSLYSSLTTDDHLDGGVGDDSIRFNVNVRQTLTSDMLSSIETINLGDSDNTNRITTADDLISAGGSLHVNAFQSVALKFNGAAETNGAFIIEGSDWNDTLIGGKGDDSLDGLGGNNVLSGGQGADTISVISGEDTVTWRNVQETRPNEPDYVVGAFSDDTLDLSSIDADRSKAGNQAFVRVDHFDGHAGEVMLTYNADTQITTLAMYVDADSKADGVILVLAEEFNFPGLVL
jgi:Ca2+-binding RTX toxin-like protein